MSKILKLDFDTKELKLKGEAPENKPPSATELTRRIIGNMIFMYSEMTNMSKRNQGLLKMERSQAYWLQSNLEIASKDKLLEIEIPDDVFGFLRKIFRDTPASPDKIMECVERNIDSVKVE